MSAAAMAVRRVPVRRMIVVVMMVVVVVLHAASIHIRAGDATTRQ